MSVLKKNSAQENASFPIPRFVSSKCPVVKMAINILVLSCEDLIFMKKCFYSGNTFIRKIHLSRKYIYISRKDIYPEKTFIRKRHLFGKDIYPEKTFIRKIHLSGKYIYPENTFIRKRN